MSSFLNFHHSPSAGDSGSENVCAAGRYKISWDFHIPPWQIYIKGRKKLNELLVCMYMCVSTCAHVSVLYGCMGGRHGPSVNPKTAILARLTGQWALRFGLFLPTNDGITDTNIHAELSDVETWGLKAGSQTCIAKPFTLSHYPSQELSILNHIPIMNFHSVSKNKNVWTDIQLRIKNIRHIIE